jgi:hypothetical protein
MVGQKYEVGHTNHNAFRLYKVKMVVSITCDVCQCQADMLKNGSIVGVRFHDFKRGLSG